MRAFQRLAVMGALSAGLSLPAIMSGGAGVPRFQERTARERDPDEDPRARLATKRGRAIGKRTDPFYEIASKGRRGARGRMLKMEAALATTPRGTLAKRAHGGKVKSKPFHSDARNAAFVAALNAGNSHNQALKLARRVTV